MQKGLKSWFRKWWGLQHARREFFKTERAREDRRNGKPARTDEAVYFSRKIREYFKSCEKFDAYSRAKKGPGTRGIENADAIKTALQPVEDIVASLKQNFVAVPKNLVGSRRALFALLAGGSLLAAAAPAQANTPFTSFAFPGGAPPGGSASPTPRTAPDRVADIFNAKEYGALGTGGGDDTTAIRAALSAMWGNTFRAGTLYFPIGIYTTTEEIDIGHLVGDNTNGRIVGAGRSSTAIIGTVNNGFIFAQADSPYNGPEELSSLAIINNSTYLGTGALRFNNSSMHIRGVHFAGMVNVLMPFNIFDAVIENCLGGNAWSDPTTGYNGTFGIIGYQCHVHAWRTTTPFSGAIMLWGANGCELTSNGIENCHVAVGLGFHFGWASSCTISGTTLTVGGTMGSLTEPQFQVGDTLFMRGVTLPTWGADPSFDRGVIITGLGTGAGYAGTYTISASFAISTPVPCLTRQESFVSIATVNGLQAEACWFTVYASTVSAGVISNTGGGSAALECVDAFGTRGFTAHSGIYLGNGSAMLISACGPNNNPSAGCVYIRPNGAFSNVTWISVIGLKNANTITDANSTISNGSGGSGDILSISAIASADTSIGINMAVTGTSVSANDTIIGSYYNDATLRTSTTLNPAIAGSISGNTLTVTATAGTIRVGDVVIGPGVRQLPDSGTIITAQLTGSPGSTGTYSVNGATQTVSSTGSNWVSSRAGYGGVGNYRVSNAQNLSARVITIVTGADWVPPTNGSAKAGHRFINCGGILPAGYPCGLASFNMVFDDLPGQANSSTSNTRQLLPGASYFIVDGAKSGGGTAAPGDVVQGGGTQKIPIFWDNTNWRYGGSGQFS